MNILSTQYTLSNKAFEIYVAGCNGQPHCKNCHNPVSWNFNYGDKYTLGYFQKNIRAKVKQFDKLVRQIMIFGGEPLDQPIDELIIMLEDLSTLELPIWLFTRYEINEVPQEVKQYCDYIKCGRYVEELACESNEQYGINLATSNQNVYRKGVDY